MQIEIPQYISAYTGFRLGKMIVHVYIGDAEVYEFDAEEYSGGDWAEEEIKLAAVSAFGRMLALKIGD